MITYSLNPNVIGKTYNGHQMASTGWIQKSSSILDLMDATAIRGQAMMPGLRTNKGKLKKHLYQSCTIDKDVDNKGIDQTTWEDAINHPFLKHNAIAIWTSTHHKRDDENPDSDYLGQNSFRAMLKLDKDFRFCPADNSNNHKQIHNIIKQLNALIPGSDPNIIRIHHFAGTIDGLVNNFKMGQNRLNLDLLPEQEQKQSNPKLVITTLMDPQKTASSM